MNNKHTYHPASVPGGITITLESFDKAKAEATLAKHFVRVANGDVRQRNVRRKTTTKYTSDMKTGKWLLATDMIAFDVNDDLINGQHRLSGVVKSDTEQEFFVSRGWPAKDKGKPLVMSTIDILDRPAVRSTGEQLGMHGYKYGNHVSACVSGVVRTILLNRAPGVSFGNVCHILSEFGMEQHIEALSNIFHHNIRFFRGRLLGPLAIYRTVRKRKADQFLEHIVQMDAPAGSGPNIYLRFIANHGKDNQDDAIRALCSAIRVWDKGEDRDVLKPTIEAVRWLSNLNPELHEKVVELIAPYDKSLTVELPAENE